MTSIKAKLRASSVKGKVGKLFIQLIHNREIKTITTPFKLMPHEWSEKEQCIITDSKQMSRAIELCAIEKDLNKELESIVLIINKLRKRISYTVVDIIELYTGKNRKSMLSLFVKKCTKELRTNKKENTAYKYEVTLRQFLAYRNGVDISFEHITSGELKRFEEYLKKRNVTMNTISFYMRIMRAIYNKAISAGVAPEQNPFRDVYTGIAKTVKRATDEVTIQRLKLLEFSPKLAFARDMFLFSFYTRGMSYIDMANLIKTNCVNGLLTYRRSKTGQFLKIRLEPCIVEIIKRYEKQCKNEANLLPITVLDGAQIRYATTIRTYNDRLKIISKQLRINPPLTSYVARHTWASLARKKGVNLSIISEGMGHASEKTTQIYLSSLDQKLLDEANKMVISYIKKTK